MRIALLYCGNHCSVDHADIERRSCSLDPGCFSRVEVAIAAQKAELHSYEDGRRVAEHDKHHWHRLERFQVLISIGHFRVWQLGIRV